MRKFITSSAYRNMLISIIVFFCVFFVFGIAVYKDYGLCFDNTISRINGIMAYRYLTGDRAIETYVDRDYGTGIELPLVLAEIVSKPQTTQTIYYQRYILSYCLFLISLLSFIATVFLITKKWWLGIIGGLSIALYPRIFSDAFTNSKDVGLLSAFVLSIFILSLAVRKKNIFWIIVHGVFVGFTISVRPLGILLILLTIVRFLAVKRSKPMHLKKIFTYCISFLLAVSFGTLMFWPYLWPNPIGRFAESLVNFSHFRYQGTVLYLGDYILATKIPWHYIPVWIGISVPSFILLFSLAGCTVAVISLFRLPGTVEAIFRQTKQSWGKEIPTILVWIFAPLFTIIALHSVVYDGWRHVYFIYPALVLVSLIFIDRIWEVKKLRTLFRIGIMVILCVQFSALVYWSVRTHPNEYVYFNVFAGGMKQAKKLFDLDYLAISYRLCIKEILARDSRQKIKVYLHFNDPDILSILSPQDQQRLVAVEKAGDADYFISNYRLHPDEYPVKALPFYTVEIDGTRIAVVYKIAQQN